LPETRGDPPRAKKKRNTKWAEGKKKKKKEKYKLDSKDRKKEEKYDSFPIPGGVFVALETDKLNMSMSPLPHQQRAAD
jgi:hypothetical protein